MRPGHEATISEALLGIEGCFDVAKTATAIADSRHHVPTRYHTLAAQREIVFMINIT